MDIDLLDEKRKVELPVHELRKISRSLLPRCRKYCLLQTNLPLD